VILQGWEAFYELFYLVTQRRGRITIEKRLGSQNGPWDALMEHVKHSLLTVHFCARIILAPGLTVYVAYHYLVLLLSESSPLAEHNSNHVSYLLP
jgi:hypothetical protein